ncbi:sugar 3,4-ketoisomerase [Succinivibrio sp.]|jgi:dTDP-4-dehydrorhamnose 3,5-epimerase-like enzyme|uniref:sugar 3,4-ketoisomerase n=1 Tax=Succinivibrio sp. TaxID=2053619 RepID=UPI002A907083|nr:FdtA/QdtA family cupin domain-containing protein [Succinivibrio sp.]MDY4993612.1 FdtA/QdtA family cupin domain-containing protein [Succinivibrio sp.]
MNYLLLNFPIHGDHNGKLVALEKRADFPFEIRRVYYVWDTAHDAIRGKHAHRNLEQVIICVRGSCDFIVDDGVNRETIHLNNPAQGLYISNYVWREFTNFSEDCMVVVLASEHYNPDDYIHDYEEFKKSVAKSKK